MPIYYHVIKPFRTKFLQLQRLLLSIAAAQASSSPPEITQHPHNATVVRNEPVTLDCRASSADTIEWFREGEPVRTAPDDPTSHRILLPDGSLFFLKAVQTKKDTDAGVYWCVAANKHGVARSNNATLDIACKCPTHFAPFVAQ